MNLYLTGDIIYLNGVDIVYLIGMILYLIGDIFYLIGMIHYLIEDNVNLINMIIYLTEDIVTSLVWLDTLPGTLSKSLV